MSRRPPRSPARSGATPADRALARTTRALARGAPLRVDSAALARAWGSATRPELLVQLYGAHPHLPFTRGRERGRPRGRLLVEAVVRALGRVAPPRDPATRALARFVRAYARVGWSPDDARAAIAGAAAAAAPYRLLGAACLALHNATHAWTSEDVDSFTRSGVAAAAAAVVALPSARDTRAIARHLARILRPALRPLAAAAAAARLPDPMPSERDP